MSDKPFDVEACRQWFQKYTNTELQKRGLSACDEIERANRAIKQLEVEYSEVCGQAEDAEAALTAARSDDPKVGCDFNEHPGTDAEDVPADHSLCDGCYRQIQAEVRADTLREVDKVLTLTQPHPIGPLAAMGWAEARKAVAALHAATETGDQT